MHKEELLSASRDATRGLRVASCSRNMQDVIEHVSRLHESKSNCCEGPRMLSTDVQNISKGAVEIGCLTGLSLIENHVSSPHFDGLMLGYFDEGPM